MMQLAGAQEQVDILSMAIDNARFRKPVLPGDRLSVDPHGNLVIEIGNDII